MPRTPARRGLLTRALLSLAVLAAAAFLLLTSAPRLGLDLRGGTQITLATRDSPTVTADAETTDRTLEVLRRRIDALGVAEPMLARSGETRILIELRWLQRHTGRDSLGCGPSCGHPRRTDAARSVSGAAELAGGRKSRAPARNGIMK